MLSTHRMRDFGSILCTLLCAVFAAGVFFTPAISVANDLAGTPLMESTITNRSLLLALLVGPLFAVGVLSLDHLLDLCLVLYLSSVGLFITSEIVLSVFQFEGSLGPASPFLWGVAYGICLVVGIGLYTPIGWVDSTP